MNEKSVPEQAQAVVASPNMVPPNLRKALEKRDYTTRPDAPATHARLWGDPDGNAYHLMFNGADLVTLRYPDGVRPGCACIRMGTFNPCRLCSNSWPGRIRTRPWRWNSLPPWKCGTCAPSARRVGRRFWGKPGIRCFSASTACTFPIGICCSASMACPLPGPRRALSERTAVARQAARHAVGNALGPPGAAALLSGAPGLCPAPALALPAQSQAHHRLVLVGSVPQRRYAGGSGSGQPRPGPAEKLRPGIHAARRRVSADHGAPAPRRERGRQLAQHQRKIPRRARSHRARRARGRVHPRHLDKRHPHQPRSRAGHALLPARSKGRSDLRRLDPLHPRLPAGNARRARNALLPRAAREGLRLFQIRFHPPFDLRWPAGGRAPGRG